jgi:hypothetical protein
MVRPLVREADAMLREFLITEPDQAGAAPER